MLFNGIPKTVAHTSTKKNVKFCCSLWQVPTTIFRSNHYFQRLGDDHVTCDFRYHRFLGQYIGKNYNFEVIH